MCLARFFDVTFDVQSFCHGFDVLFDVLGTAGTRVIVGYALLFVPPST